MLLYLLTVLGACPAIAATSDWLPLAVGNSWTYAHYKGGDSQGWLDYDLVVEILRTELVNGKTYYVFSELSGGNFSLPVSSRFIENRKLRWSGDNLMELTPDGEKILYRFDPESERIGGPESAFLTGKEYIDPGEGEHTGHVFLFRYEVEKTADVPVSAEPFRTYFGNDVYGFIEVEFVKGFGLAGFSEEYRDEERGHHVYSNRQWAEGGFVNGKNVTIEEARIQSVPGKEEIVNDSLPEAAIVRLGNIDFDKPPVSVVSFLPDGHTVATGIGTEAELWDVETSRKVATVHHEHPVTSLSVSPDGSTLAISGHGSTWIQLIDIASTQLKGALQMDDQSELYHASYLPEGDTFAAIGAGPLGDVIVLWDTMTGEIENSIGLGGNSWDAMLAISPDGSMLATGGSLTPLRVWDTETGRNLCGSERDEIISMAFSPDGTTLAVSMWKKASRKPSNGNGDFGDYGYRGEI